jgi:hypothetical protein
VAVHPRGHRARAGEGNRGGQVGHRLERRVRPAGRPGGQARPAGPPSEPRGASSGVPVRRAPRARAERELPAGRAARPHRLPARALLDRGHAGGLLPHDRASARGRHRQRLLQPGDGQRSGGHARPVWAGGAAGVCRQSVGSVHWRNRSEGTCRRASLGLPAARPSPDNRSSCGSDLAGSLVSPRMASSAC